MSDQCSKGWQKCKTEKEIPRAAKVFRVTLNAELERLSTETWSRKAVIPPGRSVPLCLIVVSSKLNQLTVIPT